MAGTVGAIFNGALQFGSAIGLAAFSSIETSVEATHGGARGRAAAFWFLGGIVLIEILSVVFFYQTSTGHGRQGEPDQSAQNNAAVAAPEEKWG